MPSIAPFPGLFSQQDRATKDQEQSIFFKLPLELRCEVYMYIFASSMIHEPAKKPLSDWDNLLLTCRRVKAEMEALPPLPIISLVEVNWRNNFPEPPLQITYTVQDSGETNLCVEIPYSAFQHKYKDQTVEYIPKYISPLFRIFTDAVTIKFWNDGYPGPSRIYLTPLLNQVIGLIWAREIRSFWMQRIVGLRGDRIAVPCRNYFNAKRVVLVCLGKPIYQGRAMSARRLSLFLQDMLSRPMLMRMKIQADVKESKPQSSGFKFIEEVRWQSSSRFRS